MPEVKAPETVLKFSVKVDRFTIKENGCLDSYRTILHKMGDITQEQLTKFVEFCVKEGVLIE